MHYLTSRNNIRSAIELLSIITKHKFVQASNSCMSNLADTELLEFRAFISDAFHMLISRQKWSKNKNSKHAIVPVTFKNLKPWIYTTTNSQHLAHVNIFQWFFLETWVYFPQKEGLSSRKVNSTDACDRTMPVLQQTLRTSWMPPISVFLIPGVLLELYKIKFDTWWFKMI